MKRIITILTLITSLGLLAQPSGTLDTSFGNGGKVITSISTGQDKAYGVSIQSDGKIVVAGYTTSTVTSKDFAVARYNSDGSLDNTFGTNGVVTTDLQLGSDDVAYSMIIQSDEKIILAGYSDNGSQKYAALVRYTSNGTLDNYFGTNGIVLSNFGTAQKDEIKVVKIHQLSGNIIVGGSSILNSSNSLPLVARYLSDGTLDNSFNSNGARTSFPGSTANPYLLAVEDLTILPNGKITGVGWREIASSSLSNTDFWTSRINTDGTLDNTYNNNGVSIFEDFNNRWEKAYATALRTNGKTFVAGGKANTYVWPEFSYFEINDNGSKNGSIKSFNFGVNQNDDIIYSLGIDGNENIILGGSTGNIQNKSFAISRITSALTLDNTFGTNGKLTTTFDANLLNECFDVAIQTDNKIVAVGYTNGDFAIARYLGDAVPELDNFQLISPVNIATSQNFSNLTFDWSDAFGASNYEIDIDVSPTFSSPQTFTTTISNYSANNLLPNTQYYWRVRASDGTNWGAYSTEWSFTTNTLDNFNLISPLNNSINQEYTSISFDWSNSVGATNYEIQIDTTQNFSTSPQTYSINNSAYSTNLLPLKTYYWRVRASNGTIWGQWINEWQFTTKEATFSSLNELYFSDLKIYPNPADDFIHVEISSSLINKPYKLLDNTGKDISSGIFENTEMSIQLKGLSTGFYLLQVGDSPQRTYKILKK